MNIFFNRPPWKLIKKKIDVCVPTNIITHIKPPHQISLWQFLNFKVILGNIFSVLIFPFFDIRMMKTRREKFNISMSSFYDILFPKSFIFHLKLKYNRKLYDLWTMSIFVFLLILLLLFHKSLMLAEIMSKNNIIGFVK